MCWGNGIGYCKVKKYVKKISHNSIIRFNFHTLNDINDDSLEPRRDHHQYHTQWSVAFHLKSGHSRGWLMYSDSRFPAYNLLSSSPTSLLRISMIAFLQRLSRGNRLVVMFLYRSRVYVAENVKSIITFFSSLRLLIDMFTLRRGGGACWVSENEWRKDIEQQVFTASSHRHCHWSEREICNKL